MEYAEQAKSNDPKMTHSKTKAKKLMACIAVTNCYAYKDDLLKLCKKILTGKY